MYASLNLISVTPRTETLDDLIQNDAYNEAAEKMICEHSVLKLISNNA